MWYGLQLDGNLWDIDWFDEKPSPYDFSVTLTDSHDYDVHSVNVKLADVRDERDSDWWGILKGNELIKIIQSPSEPSINDFRVPMFTSRKYHVVPLTVTVATFDRRYRPYSSPDDGEDYNESSYDPDTENTPVFHDSYAPSLNSRPDEEYGERKV